MSHGHLPAKIVQVCPLLFERVSLRVSGCDVALDLASGLIGRVDSLSALWGGEGHESHPASVCPQSS